MWKHFCQVLCKCYLRLLGFTIFFLSRLGGGAGGKECVIVSSGLCWHLPAHSLFKCSLLPTLVSRTYTQPCLRTFAPAGSSLWSPPSSDLHMAGSFALFRFWCTFLANTASFPCRQTPLYTHFFSSRHLPTYVIICVYCLPLPTSI